MGGDLDKHVFRLDIAVEKAVLMHEDEPLHHLVHDIANLAFRHVALSSFHMLVQVVFHVLRFRAVHG